MKDTCYISKDTCYISKDTIEPDDKRKKKF